MIERKSPTMYAQTYAPYFKIHTCIYIQIVKILTFLFTSLNLYLQKIKIFMG
jgi:hypothetical protein